MPTSVGVIRHDACGRSDPNEEAAERSHATADVNRQLERQREAAAGSKRQADADAQVRCKH